MTNDKELAIVQSVLNDPAVIDMQNRLNEIKAIHMGVFQKGVHYGAPYKGAKNDTLLKPGATFLQQKYGYRAIHERTETTIHVDPLDVSKSYVIIQNRCRIVDSGGNEVAQANAACTTFEDKYLYRGGAKVCPTCGGEFIIKGKAEYGGGWLCFVKKGGCGAKFEENDPAIVNQETEKKFNENPLNLLDTIVAIAEKRSEVRATIKATGIDALFSPGDGVTVKYYDDVVDGDYEEIDTATGEIKTVTPAQNGTESNEKATPSDLGEDHAQVPTDGKTERKNPFTRNGGGKKRIPPKYPDHATPNHALYQLMNAVLVPVYGNNSFHMEGSLSKLIDSGTLHAGLTLDEAIQVVKTRKDFEALPQASGQ